MHYQRGLEIKQDNTCAKKAKRKRKKKGRKKRAKYVKDTWKWIISPTINCLLPLRQKTLNIVHVHSQLNIFGSNISDIVCLFVSFGNGGTTQKPTFKTIISIIVLRHLPGSPYDPDKYILLIQQQRIFLFWPTASM
jgi:hypothetical protein